MKSRCTYFVGAVWFIIISGHSVWSQTFIYYNRFSFLGVAQALPGNQQSIPGFLPPFGPTVTVGDVTFSGSSLGTYGINSGQALFNFDSQVPLSIHFANGARAFGADFSSQYPVVPVLTHGKMLPKAGAVRASLPHDSGYSAQ